MANSYNSNPIILDTDISTGWRANQTLNTGNLPQNQYQQQVSGVTTTRQWGIRPFRIQLLSNGTTVAGTVVVADPVDATILWQAAVAAAAGAAGTILIDESFNPITANWRDFKVTGLTATLTKIQIWYRS